MDAMNEGEVKLAAGADNGDADDLSGLVPPTFNLGMVEAAAFSLLFAEKSVVSLLIWLFPPLLCM